MPPISRVVHKVGPLEADATSSAFVLVEEEEEEEERSMIVVVVLLKSLVVGLFGSVMVTVEDAGVLRATWAAVRAWWCGEADWRDSCA